MPLIGGETLTRHKNGTLSPLPELTISFHQEHGNGVKKVTSGQNARYRIELAPGRYIAKAHKNGRLVFSTGTGFVVVRQSNSTFNLIAKEGETPTEFPVTGAIERKWRQLNAGRGPLGMPTARQVTTTDGKITSQRFKHGTIVHEHRINNRPNGEAFATWGAIHAKWAQMGGISSQLGCPRTDETVASDGKGRFNHFKGGSIYWKHRTGAHVVWGAIRRLWSRLNWEKGPLGYPTSDELPTAEPRSYGRFNRFENGSIYWSSNTGAIALPKSVVTTWGHFSRERGELGFPVPKSWGRNLATSGIQHTDRNVYLFEGGAIVYDENGPDQVIRHGRLTSQTFNRNSWRKRGELRTEKEWALNSQGLTYEPGRSAADRRWYVTRNSGHQQLGSISKLDKHFSQVVASNNIRHTFGTNHVGGVDIDRNRIYVACEEPTRDSAPFVAILNTSLRGIGKAILQPREDGVDPRKHGKMPWCAINPCDGLFYTSDFKDVTEVHGYDRKRGWRYTKSIKLSRRVQRVQGGDFTPNGHLVLAIDDDANESFAFLTFFNGVTGAELVNLPVARKKNIFHFFELINQEIEGVCFQPGIPYEDRPTALHTTVMQPLDNFRKTWVKHWEIPPSQLRWL
ncbi:MAG: hypothetical protein AAF828_10410 [Bacteroidota bacterium]